MKNFFYFFISIYLGLLAVEFIFSLSNYFKSGLFIFGRENFYSPIKFSIGGALLLLFTNMFPDSSEKNHKKNKYHKK